ncbi:unnamed protein product [Coregonus sp. 'balchen']|nr:unnamed protein product [Coregonus sp. 'balchen']
MSMDQAAIPFPLPQKQAYRTPVGPIAPGELEPPGTSDDEEATGWKERVSSARERHGGHIY